MDAERGTALGARVARAHGAVTRPIPDLLIAACAAQHGADVVHVDRHFDTLAGVLGFAAVRAGPR